ncbi:unnamed protein product [Closterium sp. NIES-64]|nr:unnamed protein product [Closterium sp. NIES-64]
MLLHVLLCVATSLPLSCAHFSQYKSAQTLYDAVVARYSSPATAALSRLMLPYLFPDLSAFPTVADLITHLRTSDTRYRAALPAEFCAKNPPPMYIALYYVVARLPDSLRVVRDHFLAVCPTTLTVDPPREGPPRSGEEHSRCRSARRLPLVGDVAPARARGARARVELEGAVAVAAVAAEGVGVAAGLVAGVVVVVVAAAAETVVVVPAVVVEAAAEVEAAEVEAVEAAAEEAVVVEEVELVGVVPSSVAAGGGGQRSQRQQQQRSRDIPPPPAASEENEGYRCFQPDPGIGTAALGACEAAALGASASALSGTCETALSGTASSSSSLTFTLDSGASRSFFRDRTTLTPLDRPVAVSLADPFWGSCPVSLSTVLPCPAAPSGTLSGLYLPSFSTNLVSGADLQDVGVHQFTPASQRATLTPPLPPDRGSPADASHGCVGPSPRPWAESRALLLLGFDDYSRVTPQSSPCAARVRSLRVAVLPPLLSSCSVLQDVTFDESVPFYRLFPYRTPSLPPPRIPCAGCSAEGAGPGGAEPGGAVLEVLGLGVLGWELLSLGVAASGAVEPWVSPTAASRREPLSPQELREWFARRWRRAAESGGAAAWSWSWIFFDRRGCGCCRSRSCWTCWVSLEPSC